MSIAENVQTLMDVESKEVSLLSDSAFLLQCENELKRYIRNDYDDVYKRTLSITKVEDDGDGYALFTCADHGLGNRHTKRVTLYGFTINTDYNDTWIVVAISDDTFKVKSIYGGDLLAFGSDETGNAKSPYVSEYEAAESNFACALLLRRRKTGVMYDAVEYGDGDRKQANVEQFEKIAQIYENRAKTILYSIEYSIGMT